MINKSESNIWPVVQKILKGILHTEDENKYSHEWVGIIKSLQKDRQVTRDWHRISCTHTNPYTTKTTEWQESLHTSQY
jgi:hypothetical protein